MRSLRSIQIRSMNCNWNEVAIKKGLDISYAHKIFSNNYEYSSAPDSKYYGVNSNLRTYGDIFQRCYDPKTKRMGNRSSQDLLRIAKNVERNWNKDLQWYSRNSNKPICFLCGKPITKKSDIQSEHILPFATAVKAGVINNPKNYAPAHSKCNILKDNKLSIQLSDSDHSDHKILNTGDFNDLAKGYESILAHCEKQYDIPVLIDKEDRVNFIMNRIIFGLSDFCELELEEKNLMEQRMEILDKLAQWYKEQKIIKTAIVDGNVSSINKLIKDSEKEIKSKYYALKWKNTVIENKTIVELQEIIKEKEEKISKLETKKGISYYFSCCFKKKQ